MLSGKAGWPSVLQEPNHCGNLILIIYELKKYDFLKYCSITKENRIFDLHINLQF